MSRTNHLLTLCDAFGEAEGISHWAVSNRIFGSSDVFARLRRKTPVRGRPVTVGMDRYEHALTWFDENWPKNRAWPAGIERPKKSRRAA